VPATEAEFTVTAEVPDDVSVSDRVVEEFKFTLPKLRLGALTVNCGLAATVPVPVRATTVVLPPIELLLIVSCPVAAPATVGRTVAARTSTGSGSTLPGSSRHEGKARARD